MSRYRTLALHPTTPPRAPRGPGGLAFADSSPSPFRWRHLVGWLRKG